MGGSAWDGARPLESKGREEVTSDMHRGELRRSCGTKTERRFRETLKRRITTEHRSSNLWKHSRGAPSFQGVFDLDELLDQYQSQDAPSPIKSGELVWLRRSLCVCVFHGVSPSNPTT